jgi:hypothetical protein
MTIPITNLSFDGSPVQFRLDSPLLACFDPLALDMIRDSLPADTPLEVGGLLERVNVNYPTIAEQVHTRGSTMRWRVVFEEPTHRSATVIVEFFPDFSRPS